MSFSLSSPKLNGMQPSHSTSQILTGRVAWLRAVIGLVACHHWFTQEITTTYIVVREREDKITHTQTVPQEDMARGGKSFEKFGPEQPFRWRDHNHCDSPETPVSRGVHSIVEHYGDHFFS